MNKKYHKIIYFVSFLLLGCENDFVEDIDGNIYKTVKIGKQEWMAENLRVTHYQSGDPIPRVLDKKQWMNQERDAYCVYDNKDYYSSTYGFLYNWYAVTDTRNLAPKGWHVPKIEEWQELIIYLGGENIAGGKLKEKDTYHWDSPNIGATNEYSFDALPGGYRYDDGTYAALGYYGNYWSTTDWKHGIWYINLASGAANVLVDKYAVDKTEGISIRCIKDK